MAEKFSVDKNKVVSYLKKASEVYDLTADLFIIGSFHSLKNLVNARTLRTLINFRKLHALQSLHDFNHRELGEERLVQLFDRYATYNGSNPYRTPATLSVISHLVHNLGAFIPHEGFYAVVEALMAQALRIGVKFHFNQPVLKVKCESGKVKGIETRKGFIPSDIVVSDIDIHRFYQTLMPDKKRLSKIQNEERSSSALIFSWGMKGTFDELDIHNIFFSKNYKEEFDYLFEKKEVFDDPTVYIYISSKFRKEDAPEGYENWFVMVNAPADKGQQWEEMIARARQSILDKLERIMNLHCHCINRWFQRFVFIW
jgi:phytoene dehydrogenase-like protein